MMLVGMFAFFPLKFPFSRFFSLFVKVPNYKAAGARDGVERRVILVMVNTCKHFGGQRLLSGPIWISKTCHFSREEQFFCNFPQGAKPQGDTG